MDAMAMMATVVFEWIPAVRGVIWLLVLAGLIMLIARRRACWCWLVWLAAAVIAAGCSQYIGNTVWSRSALLIAVVCVVGWCKRPPRGY